MSVLLFKLICFRSCQALSITTVAQASSLFPPPPIQSDQLLAAWISGSNLAGRMDDLR